MIDPSRGYDPYRNPSYFIDPDTPVVDSVCPKCTGLYLWEPFDHYCINCGFRWVRRVSEPVLLRRTCAVAACQNVLDGNSKTFCKKHREISTSKRKSRIGEDTKIKRQLRIRQSRGPQMLR